MNKKRFSVSFGGGGTLSRRTGCQEDKRSSFLHHLGSCTINQIDRSRVEHGMTNRSFAKQTEKKLFTYSPIHLFTIKKCAFTLAETLITLGIIGVVAALTIPNLIQNYKKYQTINQLKATYSIFSQAINTSRAENGDISTWDKDLPELEFVGKYILPYLKIIDQNNTYSTRYPMSTLSSVRYGGYLGWNTGNTVLYTLSNGTVFWVNVNQNRISVDINGKKGPNVLGIDGFAFVFDEKTNQLQPAGYNITRERILTDPDGKESGACIRDARWGYYRGIYCAAVIMKDGWQIAKDYPWGNGGKTPITKN